MELPNAFKLEVFVCLQCTPCAGPEPCSHPCSLPPDHLSLPGTECRLRGCALVSSRDERGLPALAMTSYFLPGLRCPEQIGFTLLFGLGNTPSPVLAQACCGDMDGQLG